jgi:pimeloyl-ACP methyl ester carboxylesterase
MPGDVSGEAEAYIVGKYHFVGSAAGCGFGGRGQDRRNCVPKAVRSGQEENAMEDALLDRVAWIGSPYLREPIRGIVLDFRGLGDGSMKGGASASELEWGDAGALVVTPYHDPWAWMNPATRAFVDELVDGLFARHDLDERTPILSTGGSMGGQQALIYARYARRPVAACAVNCPVCDLEYHYGERPDLPRTMHAAFGSYGDITEALQAHSPVHQANEMPDIPYLILHGGADKAVAKSMHSDKLVEALRSRGVSVEYRVREEMGHCGPLDWPLLRRWTDFVLEHLEGNGEGGGA